MKTLDIKYKKAYLYKKIDLKDVEHMYIKSLYKYFYKGLVFYRGFQLGTSLYSNYTIDSLIYSYLKIKC